MENKKGKAGAPSKSEAIRKRSMTCSVSQSTSNAAIKLYGSRGRAIEIAVKYADIIMPLEAKRQD